MVVVVILVLMMMMMVVLVVVGLSCRLVCVRACVHGNCAACVCVCVCLCMCVTECVCVSSEWMSSRRGGVCVRVYRHCSEFGVRAWVKCVCACVCVC